MRSVYRAVAGIAVVTLIAAAFLNLQARSLENAIEQRRQEAEQAAAETVGGGALAAAVKAVQRGLPLSSTSERVETDAGVLEVAVAVERRTDRTQLVSVRVTDAGGRLLRTYETVVEALR